VIADIRLPRAELLKLRKRRGIVIPAAFLTVGAIAIMFLVIELFHVANSVKYRAAGGTSNFQHALLLMGQLAGMVAAVLVGTSAGTEDLSSGVFRELVATGRPGRSSSWRRCRAGSRCCSRSSPAPTRCSPC
jgi:hypothetical protein